MSTVDVVIPSACTCGCGTPINAKVLMVVAARRDGATVREAAERAGVSYASAKMAGRQFSRFAPGHGTHRGPWVERACRLCGRTFKVPPKARRDRCHNCPKLNLVEFVKLNCAEYDARQERHNRELRERRFALFGGRTPRALGTPKRLREMRAEWDRVFLEIAGITPEVEPMLTAEQERLVIENQRLIPWAVRKYGFMHKCPPHMDEDDLIAIGQIGLAKAAIAWDPNRGSFSTVAAYKIRGEIGATLVAFERQKRGGRGVGKGRAPRAASLDALHEVGFDAPTHDAHEFEDSEYVDDVLRRAERLDRRLPEILKRRMDGDAVTAIAADLGLTDERVYQLLRKSRELVA